MRWEREALAMSQKASKTAGKRRDLEIETGKMERIHLCQELPHKLVPLVALVWYLEPRVTLSLSRYIIIMPEALHYYFCDQFPHTKNVHVCMYVHVYVRMYNYVHMYNIHNVHDIRTCTCMCSVYMYIHVCIIYTVADICTYMYIYTVSTSFKIINTRNKEQTCHSASNSKIYVCNFMYRELHMYSTSISLYMYSIDQITSYNAFRT